MSSLAHMIVTARKRKLWTQAELAQRVDVSLSTITRAEQGKGTPNVNSLRRIAEELGFERDELIRLARGNPTSAAALAASVPGLTTADQLRQHHVRASAAFPPITRVPHYEAVSAVRADMRHEATGQVDGQWSQVPDMEIDFTVGVDGQCMEPRYEHGERIGCSIRRWQAEGFVWGKDYWIRFNDDQTTLKRVRPDPRDPEKFVCTPLNLATRPFSRLKADVVRAARVLLILAA